MTVRPRVSPIIAPVMSGADSGLRLLETMRARVTLHQYAPGADIDRMTSISILSRFDRVRFERLADWLAVGVAVSLPWSTSATGILIALWLVATLPTLDVASVRRELLTATGGLPVLLWVLAAVGMLWADVSWTERIGGLGKFHRLLVIPLLLAQFRRSEHGIWVIYGFFASMLGLLLMSWVAVAFPGLPWPGRAFGVPLKD